MRRSVHPRHELDLVRRFALAGALIVINAADVVTTEMLLRVGGREVNPVAGRLLATGHLAIVKIVVSLVAGVLILVAPLHRRVQQALWIVTIVYSVALGLHVIQLVASSVAT